MVYERLTDTDCWEPVSPEPVLSRGPAGSWDSYGVMHACLLAGEGGYRLWYEGRSKRENKVDGHIVFGSEIGFASSEDGRRWEKHPDPVLGPDAVGSWDSHHVFYPMVVRRGRELWMYYHGNDAVINRCSIGLAVSEDGISWRRHAENPVMRLNEDPEHGLINIACPNVVQTEDGYGMIYVREKPRAGGSITEVALARSKDGIRWENRGILISLATEDMCVSYPSLLAVEGRFLLWAWVFTHDPEKQNLNHLRLYGSDDLESWDSLWEEGWINRWTDNAATRRAFIPRIFHAGGNRCFMFYPIRFERGVCDTGLAVAEI